MKLLVFAHIPPPHHGQSYMVKLLLDGLGGDMRRRGKSEPRNSKSEIECYHVNCRYSDDLEDIGSFRLEKTWLLLRYCLEAIGCRFRYGVRTFYYVPAPGKRAALYRDWVVMLLCRPFFQHFVHHWHAVGLGDWLEREGTWFERWLTHRLLGRCALGIALAIPSLRDALWFRSRHVEIVPNGIPDPCPDFETTVLWQRRERATARAQMVLTKRRVENCSTFRVLFLAHCSREKGLEDTIEGVLLANTKLVASASPLRLHLTIAGAFVDDEEEKRVRQRIENEDVSLQIHYTGFVAGDEKFSLLRESDALCFPTYYSAEGQPVNLIEAMAFGLPCVTTRWRAIPDLLPGTLARFVEPRRPCEVAEALIQMATHQNPDFKPLRELFLAHFVASRHIETLKEVLQQVVQSRSCNSKLEEAASS